MWPPFLLNYCIIFFIIGIILIIIGATDPNGKILCLVFGCFFLLSSIITIFILSFGSILTIYAQIDLIIITSRTICACCLDNDKININNIQEVKFKKRIIVKEINGEYIEQKVIFDVMFKIFNNNISHDYKDDEDKNGRYELIYNTLRNLIPANVPFIEESERVLK